MAFRDIRPQAKLHYLIVPKAHIKNLKTLPPTQDSLDLLKQMNTVARDLLSRYTPEDLKPEDIVYRIGFHRSFATSQDHLHLHAFLLPFKTWSKQYIFYAPGFFFVNIDKVIRQMRKSLE